MPDHRRFPSRGDDASHRRVWPIRSEASCGATLRTIPIEGFAPVPIRPNSDPQGCLTEIFREE